MNKNSILISLFAIVTTVMFFFIVLGALKIYLPVVDSSDASNVVLTDTSIAGKGMQDKITVQVAVYKPTETLAYGDTIELRAFVKNITSKKVSYGFSSGCNAPDIYFNGKNIQPVKGCTQAFTTVDIPPQQTETSDYEYALAKDDGEDSYLGEPYVDDDGKLRLNPGTYSITAKWQDVESEAVKVTITE